MSELASFSSCVRSRWGLGRAVLQEPLGRFCCVVADGLRVLSLQRGGQRVERPWPVLGVGVLFAALSKLIPRGAAPEG